MTEALSFDSISHRVTSESTGQVMSVSVHSSTRSSVCLIDETSIWLLPCSKLSYCFHFLHVLLLLSPTETFSRPRLTFSHFHPAVKKTKKTNKNKTDGRHRTAIYPSSIHLLFKTLQNRPQALSRCCHE